MESHDQAEHPSFDIERHVSRSLRISAAWSWRILVVAAAIALVLLILSPVKEIAVAFLLAVLVSALVSPFVGWLRRRFGMNNTVAAVLGLLISMAAIAALLTVALEQLIRRMPELFLETMDGLDQLLDWVNAHLLDGSAQVSDYLIELQDDILALLKNNSSLLASEAWSLASSAIGIGASALILVFILFFFLKDGQRMWVWFVRLFPEHARNSVHEAGIRGWVTLGAYARTQIQVAAIDALGIGLGAFFLGVPLALPIAVLVFLASFIPIVGAFVSGAVAVFIALVNNGLTTAIIMVIVVLAVQQIESNVLQPWLMGQAVSLHPVAVVLAVSIGTILMGIPGALFAVPVLAVINAVTMYLHGHDPLPQLDHDENRPGGPPGTLHAMIAASYRGGGVPEKAVKIGAFLKKNASSAETEEADSGANQQ